MGDAMFVRGLHGGAGNIVVRVFCNVSSEAWVNEGSLQDAATALQQRHAAICCWIERRRGKHFFVKAAAPFPLQVGR